MAVGLPEGFVLDEQPVASNAVGTAGLPEGFVVDENQNTTFSTSQDAVTQPVASNVPPEIYSMFQWSGNPVTDTVKKVAIDTIASPLIEVSRGAMTGAAGLYDVVGGAANILRNVSGEILPTKFIEDFAKRSSESLRREADWLPDTGMNSVTKAVYGGIGSAPSDVVPFALPGVGITSTAAKFGLVKAMREYKDGQSMSDTAKSAAIGGAEGLAVASSIGLGLEVLTKAGSLMHHFGKKTAEAYIRLTTGKEQFARDYSNGKIDMKNFRDNRTTDEIKRAFDDEAAAVKAKHASELNAVQEEMTSKRNELALRMSDEKTALARANKNIEDQAVLGRTDKINDVVKESTEAIVKAEDTLKQTLMNDYEGILNQFTVGKKALGDNIGGILKKIESLAPDVGVSYSGVFNKIENTMLNDFGFTIKNGKVVPKAGSKAVSADVTREMQLFLDDMRSFRPEGAVPVGAVYRFHKAADELADKAFKAGKGDAGAMWSKVRELTTPSNVLIEGENLLTQSKLGRELLGELTKANKDFSKYKSSFDNAMKFYSKNVNGQNVPAPETAMAAIRSNNKRVLAAMNHADMALPEAQRLLPRIRQHVADYDSVKAMQEQIIRNQKSLLQRQIKNLHDTHFVAEKELAKNHRVLSAKESANMRDMIRNNRIEVSGKIQEAIDLLKKSEDTLLGKKALNSVISEGGFKQLQIGSAAFALGSMNPGAAGMALALSPKSAKLVSDLLLKAPNKNILKEAQAEQIKKLLKLK